MKLIILLTLCVIIGVVQGHGRLRKPPGRGTAWRYGFKTPPNYNDHENNCGGLGMQRRHNMKCGVCGDNYGLSRPRPHENGGRYGTGTIVGTYKSGQTIKVEVELTANHLGYFRFDLCLLNGGLETEECFRQLRMANGADREPVPRGKRNFNMEVKLPSTVQNCEQCVFRWVYVAGNNWGTDSQEHFINCADIRIN